MTDAQFSFLVGEVIKEIRGRIESKGKEYARGQTMTKTTCPTCGADCEITKGHCVLEFYECNNPKKHLEPLPQPDLTKLREIMEEWDGLPLLREEDKDLLLYHLLPTVKEVLDVETSNSTNSC